MLVDGRKIAEDILSEITRVVTGFSNAPKMVAVTCAPNFETKKYLEMKKNQAAAVGVALNVVELPAEVSTKDVVDCVKRVAAECDGVVVQLPLPMRVDREAVLAEVPVNKDPDGFSYGLDEQACFSPVVGAIDEISKKYLIDWREKRVVVLGEGRLVGKPVAFYAKAKGAKVTVLTEVNFQESKLLEADIIVSGIGRPRFVKNDMVKDGVVVFDAGTSEDGGELAGDVDEEVASKASLLTPVPGGIGPITIAYLLRNLVSLAGRL